MMWIDTSESPARKFMIAARRAYHRRKIYIAESKTLSRNDVVKFVPKVAVISSDHHVECEINKCDVKQNRSRAGESYFSTSDLSRLSIGEGLKTWLIYALRFGNFRSRQILNYWGKYS